MSSRSRVLALALCFVSGCVAPAAGPELGGAGQVKMSLISNQENTHFQIRPLGSKEWAEAGIGKYQSVTVAAGGKYEVKADALGYRPKVHTLPEPVSNLSFVF